MNDPTCAATAGIHAMSPELSAVFGGPKAQPLHPCARRWNSGVDARMDYRRFGMRQRQHFNRGPVNPPRTPVSRLSEVFVDGEHPFRPIAKPDDSACGQQPAVIVPKRVPEHRQIAKPGVRETVPRPARKLSQMPPVQRLVIHRSDKSTCGIMARMVTGAGPSMRMQSRLSMWDAPSIGCE